MGDSNFNCAASGVPIGPREAAVGILVSKSNEASWTYGLKPTSQWQFVAGPFHIPEVGNYTPLQNFREMVEKKNPKILNILQPVEHLFHHPEDLPKDRQWTGYPFSNTKLKFDWRTGTSELVELTTIWFRKDVWTYLCKTGAKSPRTWPKEIAQEILWLSRLSDELSDRMSEYQKRRTERGAETTEFDLCMQAGEATSRQEICHNGLSSFLHDYSRKLDPEWAKGFNQFLNFWVGCEHCCIVLTPNTHCHQGAWMDFEDAHKFRSYVNKIIEKATKDD